MTESSADGTDAFAVIHPVSSAGDKAVGKGRSHRPASDFKHPFSQFRLDTLFGVRTDWRAWGIGLSLGVAYAIVGILHLKIARVDAALASIWLPNAIAISVLFLARLRNEVPSYVAIAIASYVANATGGTPAAMIPAFTCGNVFGIFIVMWLTRRACGEVPDLSELSHLGHFLQYGGVFGPLVGALIVAPFMGPDLWDMWKGASSWFLVESLGVILLAPACLLLAQLHRSQWRTNRKDLAEALLIAGSGLATVYLVLNQSAYPLLFLITPITLLVAFRLGALGTALFVPGIAILSGFAGFGPIAESGFDKLAQVHLIQTFIAANFLTGLPIAAILAGRKRLSDALEQGRRELALLTEGITDAVLMIDTNGVCTYASPSVADVLGRSPESFLGQNVGERAHEDSVDRIMGAIERLLSGESDKERITYRRFLDSDEGHPVFIEADCAVLIEVTDSSRSGIIMSARDVTERVELEILLTRARKSAENAARAKSEFLANMSHEIRTPMNGVLGFAELLREGDLGEENRRHADMIVQSGRSMMMLLNDILDLSKIEAGQVGVTNEPVDLLATISECAALYRPSAEKKGLRLHFSMVQTTDEQAHKTNASAPSPWVKTDGLRLRQIILNLVGNAVKFTEEGEIEILANGDEEELYIEVKDTGIGIHEKRLQSIFAPFTQGENDTSRRYGGTGLGLSISRQLAELLGGTIDVQSIAGEGSTFRLTLPAHYTDPLLPEPVDEEPFEPAMLTQSASILLVEDHDVNRLLVSEMLERCGQSVVTAHDGNEAIAMIIDSIMRSKPFDLVLMDIQMPGCDGFSAARAIRMEGITPDDLPIIALTANAFPEDLTAAREAGMQAHLSKPLVFSELAKALQRWLPTRIVENEEAGEDTIERVASHEESSDSPAFPEEDVRRPFAAEIVDISRNPAARPPKIGEIALPETPIETHRRSRLSQFHSPSLIDRWAKRRREAIEAVRSALADGSLGEEGGSPEVCERVAKLVHKLAGTAAIFGEAELGDQAAALEHALRMRLPGDVREALAFELLSVADDPADTLAEAEG